MTTNLVRFGQLVRKRRSRLGLSQLDVWQRGGPSNTTLTKVENGLPPAPNSSTLRKLDVGLNWPAGTARKILDHGDAAAASADDQLELPGAESSRPPSLLAVGKMLGKLRSRLSPEVRSIPAIALRSGIPDHLWQAVETGQVIPSKTMLGLMGFHVGAKPDDFMELGRPDAAQALSELLEALPDGPPAYPAVNRTLLKQNPQQAVQVLIGSVREQIAAGSGLFTAAEVQRVMENPKYQQPHSVNTNYFDMITEASMSDLPDRIAELSPDQRFMVSRVVDMLIAGARYLEDGEDPNEQIGIVETQEYYHQPEVQKSESRDGTGN